MNVPAPIVVDNVRLIGGPGGEGELGRNAVKDYSEEKPFRVHRRPRTNWRRSRRPAWN